MKKELLIYVGVPALFNVTLIGLYFSGIESFQQLIAPTIEGLSSNVWREFGLLEQLQNIFLLAVIVILSLSAINNKNTLDRLCLLGGVLFFVFLLLEEIDYGLHFYEFFIGDDTGIEVRNWHNQRTDGEQNVKKSKQLMDVLMFMLFIVLPLIKNKISIQFIRNITPSRWFIAGFALTIILAKIAHSLDDQGMAVINGTEGNLTGNISEFRELSNYYFFMLYASQLLRLQSLFGINDTP